jgi:predicted DCC family thiol-disulfide oxidoreductase YuxK
VTVWVTERNVRYVQARPTEPKPIRTAVLYDRDCGFCKLALNQILRWDRAHRLEPVPIQSDEGRHLLSAMDPDERFDSWHLITERGKLYSAGAAAAPLARVLPGGQPLAALFTTFPGATETAYRFIADHRATFARLLRVDASCEVRS